MRFRSSSNSTVPRRSMSAMIDVVFLLLIFFMLTLQIAVPEGVHAVETPAAGPGPVPEVPVVSEVRVRLIADADGHLAEIRLGRRSLGNGDKAIERLGQEVQTLAFEARGIVDDGLPVIIEADPELQFTYSLRALGACQKQRHPDGQLETLRTRVRMVSP